MNRLIRYLKAVAIVIGCTILAQLIAPISTPATLIMLYLLGVVFVAARYGRGASIMASLLSVAVLDFLYVPPYLTLAVADTQYLVTFIAMLLVSLTISTLTARLQKQAEAATEREQRTATLYALSRVFANEYEPNKIINAVAHHIANLFGSRVVIWLPNADGTMNGWGDRDIILPFDDQWVTWLYEGKPGEKNTLMQTRTADYRPLMTGQKGKVIGILQIDPPRPISPSQSDLLENFANQMMLALERIRLNEAAEHAQAQVENERLRNLLLSSVSHDLRTPLAAITGAVSSLLENDGRLDAPNRKELAEVAYEESERLNRLVGNLLEMTRLESGGVRVHKELQPLEEVVGTTLSYLNRRLDDHDLTTDIPLDLPPVPLDGVLIEQVLVNLLENAIKYSTPHSPITLSASAAPNMDEIMVEIADRGIGLPPGDEQRVFDKFYRARPATASGIGLGLAIAAGIIKAHGGRMWAENRAGGGAVFRFTLPLEPAKVEDTT